MPLLSDTHLDVEGMSPARPGRDIPEHELARVQGLIRIALGAGILLAVVALVGVAVAGNRGPALVAERPTEVSRILQLGLVTQVTALVLLGYLKRPLADLLAATAAPLNLAMLRIIWFSYLFTWSDLPFLTSFAALPKAFVFPPVGSELLLNVVPVDPTWTGGALVGFRLFCLLAAVGLFARTSGWLAVLLGVYVLGIPQFYGKVAHYHHLLWFGAILASSRCADVLSVDAVRKAWKHPHLPTPQPAWSYAIPLRLIWLLMGLIYFFPGLWKFARSGWAWALSDNLKFQMYDKWMDIGGWEPLFRIDHYPLLYKGAALGTLVFELSFLFLVLLPSLRKMAAVVGILFHQLSNLFMHIPFWALQLAYASFVNWEGLFRWLGRRLYRAPLQVVYDGEDSRALRLVASLRALDLFGRVSYVDTRDESALASLPNGRAMASRNGVWVITDHQWLTGRPALRALAARVPLLWVMRPAFRRSYRTGGSRTVFLAGQRAPSSRPAVAVGVVLLAGTLGFGFLRIGHAWPLAVYPRFDSILGATTTSVDLAWVDESGQESRLDDTALSSTLGVVRYHTLVQRIGRADDPERARLLTALAEVLTEQVEGFDLARSLRLYRLEQWTEPERRGDNPRSRQLVTEIEL